MLVIPAIDLIEGRCVRLKQGRLNRETVFSKEPVSVAKLWQHKGAKLLHIVDLEGAFAGEPKNLDVVKQILAVVTIPVQLGGGIRDRETIKKAFDCGVERVVLGTRALQSPSFIRKLCKEFGPRVMVGVDSLEGKVAIKGWSRVTPKDAIIFAQLMEKSGVKTIIYTDIKRDGMLKGPNLEGIREIVSAVGIEVIACGGISSLEDIKNLKAIERLKGVIIGKAIYTGAVDLKKAIKLAET